GDRRPEATRPIPAHALSEEERARILAVANEPRFADQPPARIVPALARSKHLLIVRLTLTPV
ncbi:MAG: IS3 family transposase, partial [Azonexus sp.]|nr:IS3 family transposase [Azonexus sp.]